MIGVAAAGIVALADWVAVGRGERRLEALLKPLVPAVLAGVALAVHGWWFAVALVLCLAGDVLLLPQVDRFRAGLAAFLLGHLAFIAGLLARPVEGQTLAFALPILIGAAAVGARLLTRVPPSLRVPVAIYMLVLLAMFATATATGNPLAFAGALAFLLSDTMLAWNRFIGPLPGRRLSVMVTYHLAIGALTASLLF